MRILLNRSLLIVASSPVGLHLNQRWLLTGISALNPLSSFIALQSYQSIWCKQWIEREHDFVINLAYAERLTLWIKPTKCWLQLPLFQAVFRFAVIFLKLFIFNQIFWLAAISLAFMQIVGAPNKQSYSWPQRDSFQFELFNKYSPQRPDHLDGNFVGLDPTIPYHTYLSGLFGMRNICRPIVELIQIKVEIMFWLALFFS